MPAVRDSKHNSLSTGTRKDRNYQGRVNPDELVDDYSRLRPPRRNRRVSAAAATVAVAAVGVAGVAYLASRGDGDPGNTPPGVSDPNPPDTPQEPGNPEAPAVTGTPLERFMAMVGELQSGGHGDLAAAVEEALGSKIPTNPEYTEPPGALGENTMFFISPETKRRLGVTMIPMNEQLQPEYFVAPYASEGVEPLQDPRFPGFDVYYNFSGDGKPVSPSDATAGRALFVPNGPGRDYILFVQLHQLPSLDLAERYGVAPAPQNGGAMAMNVAEEVIKIVG